jgi:hypothetical protein
VPCDFGSSVPAALQRDAAFSAHCPHASPQLARGRSHSAAVRGVFSRTLHLPAKLTAHSMPIIRQRTHSVAARRRPCKIVARVRLLHPNRRAPSPQASIFYRRFPRRLPRPPSELFSPHLPGRARVTCCSVLPRRHARPVTEMGRGRPCRARRRTAFSCKRIRLLPARRYHPQRRRHRRRLFPRRA